MEKSKCLHSVVLPEVEIAFLNKCLAFACHMIYTNVKAHFFRLYGKRKRI